MTCCGHFVKQKKWEPSIDGLRGEVSKALRGNAKEFPSPQGTLRIGTSQFDDQKE